MTIMKKKTYGVSGYIEWVAGISAGNAMLQVPFTGGAITKYGIVPAEYTTTDPLIQHLIENSRQFRSKRIFLLESKDITPKEHKEENTRMQVKEVSDLADAADFLRREFNIPAARVKSAEEAKRIGREHNIKLTGI